ncbi:acetyl-CoA carboxylase carboxyltransferase subunit alpha [Candidatus Ruminimicrobium bovinum]|uniref:acetyl-CoA carboxylase carboxyltransferase subunit alpha n=1 Tax=Candidatus Ruminimicrobium bovinum TaxID=3242779 RepID=UPI0039B837CE
MSEFALDFEQPVIELEKKILSLKVSAEHSKIDFSSEIADLEEKKEKLKKRIYGSLTSWQKIAIARHPDRPYTLDYIKYICENFVELHGDRVFGDDPALVCGLATIDTKPVVVIGHQKGKTIQENLDRNFAMAHPEGYRKALRLMKFAEKFNKPIITFIGTAGAYPGIAAEERGQAEAIARNLREMSNLKVPVISIVIGEGGSGGALGIGVANRVLMLENAYYSVISPEGCAAILFRDATKAKEAAEALKITAKDLLKFKVIDEIIPEPIGGAHIDPVETAMNVKRAISKHLSALLQMSKKELSQDRYNKFRVMGVYEENLKEKAIKNKSAEKNTRKIRRK